MKDKKMRKSRIIDILTACHHLEVCPSYANFKPMYAFPPMQETQETGVPSLGWEDLLEVKMATHSSILARKIPWTEEPGQLQDIESQRVGHD